MDLIDTSAIRMTDRSNIAEVRRAAHKHAERLGWRAGDGGDCEIVATELATNLIKHARDGVVVISSRFERKDGEILVLAVDKGPGMADIERCLRDGYSTAGSPGTGLGAVQRLAQEADLASGPEGTVIVATLKRPASGGALALNGAAAAPLDGLRTAAFELPKEGQIVNGDGWAYRSRPAALAVFVCDGLGHGEQAHVATRLAIGTFLGQAWESPKDALALIDRALRPTRGAAAAVAVIDTEQDRVRFCGVGNIVAGIVTDERPRHLVSQNGILGSAARRLTEFDYPWHPDATLIMHSDGANSHWQMAKWTGIWQRHPALLAGMIYRDCARGTDDVVAVAVHR